MEELERRNPRFQFGAGYLDTRQRLADLALLEGLPGRVGGFVGGLAAMTEPCGLGPPGPSWPR